MDRPITNSKILSHIDRVVGDHRPITADIFLDNYCNNDCSYCTYKRWEFDNDARSMPFDDFVKYATRLRELGVLGFILTGGGEPTIAKDFDKITAWLDEQNLHYGINTNFNRYSLCHPDYLKVSLDGWDNRSYREKRGTDSYEIVRDNIIRFASEKSEKTRLGIQLLAKSADDVYCFYATNRHLPVDYIVIRPVESTNGEYYLRENEDDTAEICRVIKKLQDYDNRVIMNYKWHMLDLHFGECVGQWSQIAVNEIGEVMYCCHKPYQIIGHIMDDDILEKKASAVTDMELCDIPCRLSSVNKTLLEISTSQFNSEFL